MSTKNQQRLKLIRRAVEERTYLLNISDVLGYAVGYREKDGKQTDEPALKVYVKKGRKKTDPQDHPRHQRIPRQVRLTVKGETVWLPVDLIESEQGQLHQSNGPSADFVSGLSVGNQLSANNTGTIGWIARSLDTKQPVICGNFHVFLRISQNSQQASDYRKNGFKLSYPRTTHSSDFVVSPSLQDHGDPNLNLVGPVLDGQRTQTVDIAIASLIPGKTAQPIMKSRGPLGTARFLKASDLTNPIQVFIYGRTSKDQAGTILEYPAHHEFSYPDRALMLLDMIATDIQTQRGDSGSLLVDETNRPLGMLIGLAAGRSFFMHIQNIATTMRLTDLENTA